MKYRLIKQEGLWTGIDNACRAMGVSRGGYWAWTKRKPGSRQEADSVLLSKIRDIYVKKRGVYGSPRIHDALKQKGIHCGKKRVERLMRDNEIRAKQAKTFTPKTTDSNHKLPIADNLLNREFTRSKPNDACSPLTYIYLYFLYLYT